MKYRIAGLFLALFLSLTQLTVNVAQALPVISLELNEPPLETTIIQEDK